MNCLINFLAFSLAVVRGYNNIPDPSPLSAKCDVLGESWSYSESIDHENRLRLISAKSCPNHFSSCQSSECGGPNATRALIIDQSFSVPLYPGFASTSPIDMTCATSKVGIAINGVGIYGQSDDKTSTCQPQFHKNFSKEAFGRTACEIEGKYDGIQYCGNAVAKLGNLIDKCGGVATEEGTYKYHIPPACLLNQIHSRGVAGHSPQVGWAMDGFPIFGPIGPKGIAMYPCTAKGLAHPQICLDACNGYYGALPGYDKFLYRYYITGEVGSGECSNFVENKGNCDREESQCCVSIIPSAVFKPYSVGCFRGCPVDDENCKLSGKKGVADDYIPEVTEALPGVIDHVEEYPLPTASPTASPTTAPVATVSSEGNTLPIVTRDPFTRQLSITRFNLSDQEVPVQKEALLSSSNDAFFTGLAFDDEKHMIYYTTQSAIYQFNQRTKKSKVLLAGMLQVKLKGFNLGRTVSDLHGIKVKGRACTSIVHYNSTDIHCILAVSGDDTTAMLEDVQESDVQLTTIGGSAVGTYPKPEIIVRSGTGRPVLATIEFRILPFVPSALAVVVQQNAAGSAVERTLYWSNVAVGGYSIQRSRIDGSQIETVVNNIQECSALRVLPSYLSSNNTFLSLTDCGEDCPSEESRLAGHTLLFLDAERGTLNTLHLLPIDEHKVLVSLEDIDLGRDSVYRTRRQEQDVAEAEDALFRAVTVLSGLSRPRSFTTSTDNRLLMLTTGNGLLFKISLPHVLALNSSNSSSSEPILLDTTSILREVTTSVSSGLSTVRYALPVSWIEVTLRQGTHARLGGVCMFIYGAHGNSSNSGEVQTWTQQRIFVVDGNRQLLLSTSESGYPASSFDLANKQSILWPSQLQCSAEQQEGETVYSLHVTEYFGRLWKVALMLDDETGSLSVNDAGQPELLLDRSQFPASVRLRALVDQAQTAGSSVSNLMFMETL